MPNTKPHPTWTESRTETEIIEELDIPTRLVVDETTFERIVDRMEHPRPPTPAMLALFRK